ncbi:NAD-dependent epimerase/dehydratase family protein [Actinomycetospora cinnamomea]|uniref:Nucleoside-diphosphate-sugar epimerase n=1 Tax=Actinomycetospora cinnamomea TaxID=663609 RepID=A0A2U1FQF1_9PSEU|nr:NAD-dependent epimerase/dehydratase family protein [Actinomycetospora cinnamomea]PVZ14376.1 nucleoside-diphosphate-sugar epimerase [Actinomycetospora cinnamomea]
MTVAVTGATGTFGSSLLPLLALDPRVAGVVGVSRHPDSGTGTDRRAEFRRGDVRDQASLESAFRGADVVVHLAYDITGTTNPGAVETVNAEGARAAFRAAVAAGARRFVYASSVAAYGFSDRNPIGMPESHPLGVHDRFFYARDKARSEQLLAAESAHHPEVEVHVLRPSGVVGPELVGAKLPLPGPLAALGGPLLAAARQYTRLGLPLAVPAFPLQLVHQDDVGEALRRCALGDGPAGPYNIAGDGVVTLAELARELGARVLELPAEVAAVPSRAVMSLPLPLPYPLQWIAAGTYPAIMDTTRAKEELGWRPRFTGLGAWRDTVRR